MTVSGSLAKTTTPSDFYEAAANIDRIYSKTSHGRLTDGPNLFARAFNIYVVEKLSAEGKKYKFTDFENQNNIWYSGYCTTHPTLEERIKFADLFDTLIKDLKEKEIIKELTTGKKMDMNDVYGIVDDKRKSRSTPSYKKVAAPAMYP